MNLDNNERLKETDRLKRQLHLLYLGATTARAIQVDIDHIMVATNHNMQTWLLTATIQDMPLTQDTIHTVSYSVESKTTRKQNKNQEQKKSLRKKKLKLKVRSLLQRQKQKQKSLSKRNQKRKRAKRKSLKRVRKARKKEKQMRTKPIINTPTSATILIMNGWVTQIHKFRIMMIPLIILWMAMVIVTANTKRIGICSRT